LVALILATPRIALARRVNMLLIGMFRFLKDKSFHVSEVYLKKESRIEALAMIMVLCLFIYSIAQRTLRQRLKETGKFVRNQVNKPVQNPTMRWVFFMFRGDHRSNDSTWWGF